MTLPIRTTIEDIQAVCGYLSTKPTGATLPEAKAVVDKKRVDGRKLAALRTWGLVEDYQDKLRITELGRQFIKDAGAGKSQVLRDVLRTVEPYQAVIERSAHRNEMTMTATEVAAHWHEHFADHVSTTERGLNDQAVCFFQVAQGADLGELTIGRKGNATRFDFDADSVGRFVEGTSEAPSEPSRQADEPPAETPIQPEAQISPFQADINNRVFITHGKNSTILEQVKELVSYGKFEPVVASEHETAAKPVPQKVMDDMRSCTAAVIHVSGEHVFHDCEGKETRLVNQNVLIEIGAAMALYGQRFALLVEDGVDLPSNLQGLYECRYSGKELNMPATMKLLKALSEF